MKINSIIVYCIWPRLHFFFFPLTVIPAFPAYYPSKSFYLGEKIFPSFLSNKVICVVVCDFCICDLHWEKKLYFFLTLTETLNVSYWVKFRSRTYFLIMEYWVSVVFKNKEVIKNLYPVFFSYIPEMTMVLFIQKSICRRKNGLVICWYV